MANRYFDLFNGNDTTGDGTKGNPWQSPAAKATSCSAGDVLRISKTPDPQLSSMTVTTYLGNSAPNKTTIVRLSSSAYTKRIHACSAAWTANTNVTSDANTGWRRDESQYASATLRTRVITTASTGTQKLAHAAVLNTDLSDMQQVCFVIRPTGNMATECLEMKLCSDANGDTPVHTIPIPRCGTGNNSKQIVWDNGAALSNNINSVALYSTAAPGANTFWLDAFYACKGPTDANCLSLNTAFGLDYAMPWQASTAYSLNDIRQPTQVNRNGWCYKVTTAGTSGSTEPTWPDGRGLTVTDGSVVWTCEGLEHSWYGIGSVYNDELTLAFSGGMATHQWYTTGWPRQAYSARPMYTRRLYVKEEIVTGSSTNFFAGSLNGPVGGWTKYIFGCDPADLDVVNGETWVKNTYNSGSLFYWATNYNLWVENCCGTAVGAGFGNYAGSLYLKNCKITCSDNSLFSDNSQYGCNTYGQNIQKEGCHYGTQNFWWGYNVDLKKVRLSRVFSSMNYKSLCKDRAMIEDLELEHIGSLWRPSNWTEVRRCHYVGPTHDGQGGIGWQMSYGASGETWIHDMTGTWPSIGYSTITSYFSESMVSLSLPDGTNEIWTSEGLISSDEVTRHTASGKSWKFAPSGVGANGNGSTGELRCRLRLGPMFVSANSQVTVGVWCRRSNTAIKAALRVQGGQLAGMTSADYETQISAAADTWQELTISFTPTAAGAIFVYLEAWDNEAYTAWFDDFSIAQS